MKSVIEKGFTLVEMLLVMVIITGLVMMGTRYMTQRSENLRIDKTVTTVQYILNAALAFYVANGRWPDPQNAWIHLDSAGKSELQSSFLPNAPIINPYGGGGSFYFIAHFSGAYYNAPPNSFVVVINTNNAKVAKIIAGRLPLGYFLEPIWVVTYVTIPGQNLNNAMAINFAGLYHHGGCVPVPKCPTTTAGGGTTTSPQIFVMPVSVSGVNDEGSENIYPISSFTAYSTAMGAAPPACPGGTAVDCTPINGNPPESGQYWRVCMQVVTERGDVQSTRTDAWGDKVTLAAFTRCSISNEPAGSTFSVYSH